jgi:ribosomal protein S18 acetylase RimI-like enzyme
MVIIKAASKNDVSSIIDMAMQVWPQTYTPILGEVQVAYMLGLFYGPYTLERQMESNHTFLIASTQGADVAFASISPENDSAYKLHKLYILPTVQGKGVGKALIQHVQTMLQGLQVPLLRLNVNRYNTSAIGFYEKLGFSRICKRFY